MKDEIKPGYTRVSEILSILPGYKNIAPEVLERKAQVGTNVHNAIFLHGKDIPLNLTDEEQKYFESYQKWAEIVELKPILTETRLYDEGLKITGCVDYFGGFDKEYLLIDYKTSVCEDKVKWPLQAAFYHELLLTNGYRNASDRVIFLKLDKEGKMPKAISYEITHDLRAMVWNLLRVYQYVQENK